MNPISWIAEKVVTVVAQIIGNAVINKAETEALKHRVNTLVEIEAEAKKHEEAGNPLLAKILRDNGQRMSDADFSSVGFNEPKAAIEKPASQEIKNLGQGGPAKKKRGRPRKNQNSTPHGSTQPVEKDQQ